MPLACAELIVACNSCLFRAVLKCVVVLLNTACFASNPHFSDSGVNDEDEMALKDQKRSSITEQWARYGSCVFTHEKLKLKVIADVVEALIGAFLCSGGNSAARLFMCWMGIPQMMMSNTIRNHSWTLTPETLPPCAQNGVGYLSDAASQALLFPDVPLSPLKSAR